MGSEMDDDRPAFGADTFVAEPASGRVFRASRRVSVDDANAAGRMESDSIARFLQDIGNDDTDDAGLAELGLAWVARRMAIEVTTPARSRELIDLSTWCSGTGARWAERRTKLRGEHGASIDAVAVWIHLNPETGRPERWREEFSDLYLEPAQGRRVDAKLRHDKVPPEDATRHPWNFRRTDVDGFGHVNNAAYLALAEQYLDEQLLAGPHRIEIEWRTPSQDADDLVVAVSFDRRQLWLLDQADDELRVTIAARTS